jgi:thiol-disulfide isomerase/thioredoxin
MTSRWVIAGAATLSLALLTLPSLRQDGGGESVTTVAANGGGSPKQASCEAEGRATYDFVLKNEFNAPVKLADLKGKVAIVNFWATWCGPCKTEIPDFVKLYAEYKDKGLVIVGISIDDSAEQLQAFMKEYKMNYPVVQMTPDVETAWGTVLRLSDVVHRRARRVDLHQAPWSRDQRAVRAGDQSVALISRTSTTNFTTPQLRNKDATAQGPKFQVELGFWALVFGC